MSDVHFSGNARARRAQVIPVAAIPAKTNKITPKRHSMPATAPFVIGELGSPKQTAQAIGSSDIKKNLILRARPGFS